MANKPKPVDAVRNSAGGFDLLTERDGGNDILILTGKKERSLAFWKRLHTIAGNVITLLDDETEFVVTKK